MQKEWEIDKVVEEYADTIVRICCFYGKNYHDAQDIMQDVFIKLLKKNPVFESSEHQRAWIIRVTINACKDMLKQMFRKHQSLEAVKELAVTEEEDLSYVREGLMRLPAKYKEALYLHYYEGYTAAEIAEILQKKTNTIYSLLSRGRELLKTELGGDFFGTEDQTSI